MRAKVIIIGTGFGRYAMAPAYTALGCEVELLSPRDMTNIRRAIEAPCDLVSVHSPPFMHVEHVALALANQRNVLCDKPFGRNAAEARTMLDQATAAGVMHFLNFEFRFDPARAKMKALLDQGAIGAPLHFSCTLLSALARTRPHGWLFDRALGGGWIGAYASHHVDALHWLFGDIESVSCRTRIDVTSRPDRNGVENHTVTAEDAVIALFRMQNGVTSSLDTTMAAPVDLPPQTALLGSEGALYHAGGELVLRRADQEPERFKSASPGDPLGPPLAAWLARVLEALATGAAITPDFSDGLRCAEVLDRMRDAAAG